MSIRISQVSKRFGNFVALDNVSLNVPSGELLALLGPSGSGKTALLRIIAGLESPDVGSVQYENEDVTNKAPKDRQVGFVFQHYALFDADDELSQCWRLPVASLARSVDPDDLGEE